MRDCLDWEDFSSFYSSDLTGHKGDESCVQPRTYNFHSFEGLTGRCFLSDLKYLVGSRSFGIFLASIFKDYNRRLDNLSKNADIVDVIIITNIFIVRPKISNDSWNGSRLRSIISLLMSQFMLPVLVVYVAGEETLQ